VSAPAWLPPIILGYLLGSIPFGWIVVRAGTGQDVRWFGSGNVGATNVVRATGWRSGLLVAVLDLLKGSAAVGLAASAGGDQAAQALAGLGAIVGHVFPLWLRLHGGKGVATAAGVFAVLAPLPAAIASAAFVGVAGLTRLVSLASLCATTVMVGASWLVDVAPPVRLAAIAAAALIAVRHAGNIRRLLDGTERRLSAARGRARSAGERDR
jgi:glycerol-3-phosphate acyltransferase PlsY